MIQLRRLLQRPKDLVRPWLYPLQHRLPLSLALDSERRAIMVFDPSSKYGGWMDRVKGMISVFELARLTGRSFAVYAGPTFPLDGLLEPATFDWRIPREGLQWNPLDTGFHVSRDRRADDFPALRDARWKRLFVETNLDYLAKLHPQLDEPAVRSLWSTRYRELFKLAPELEREVAARTDDTAIAVHARFTSLLGDFRDVVTEVLPPREREELLLACVARIRAMSREHAKSRIVVLSDSVTFLRECEQLGGNVTTIPGAPTHLDHAETIRESLRKTLLDFYVMARCARIVQLRIGRMYNSAFSRYASYVRNVPFSEST